MYLSRVGSEPGLTVYQSGNGDVFELRPVNRKYPGNPKAPVRYLSQNIGGRSVYLSGLFKTKHGGLFSLDINGKMYRLRIFAGGAVALLEPGRAEAFREPAADVVKRMLADFRETAKGDTLSMKKAAAGESATAFHGDEPESTTTQTYIPGGLFASTGRGV